MENNARKTPINLFREKTDASASSKIVESENDYQNQANVQH
jgi:hypothetical protein